MKKNYPAAKIGIILPTYNVEQYIDRALSSCTKQSLIELEIIVVDDCGSDSSMKKVYDWQRKDSRIKVVRNPKNLGTYHARRAGVEHASADYIIFLDPDDELRVDTAEVINRVSERNHPDLILFNVAHLPKSPWQNSKETLPTVPIEGEDLPHRILMPNMSFGTAGKAYHRHILLKAYREFCIPQEQRLIFAEDALILYGVLAYSKIAISIDLPLYRYYRNPGSAMTNREPEFLQYKIQQINDVILHLEKFTPTEISETRKNSIKKTREVLIKKLTIDKLFISRHTFNANGQNQYLKNMSKIIFHHHKWKELPRIFLFFASAGAIRL